MRGLLVLGLIAAALGAGLVGASFWRERQALAETGFVAVKTTFALPSARDTYHLGEATLEPLNKGVPAEATFKEKAGPARLQLRRAGQTHDLCEVRVRPNRITTVTVVAVNNRIGCKIEA